LPSLTTNRGRKIDRGNLPSILQMYYDYMKPKLSIKTIEDKLYTLLKLDEFLKKRGNSIEHFSSSNIQEYLSDLVSQKERKLIGQNHIHGTAIYIKRYARWLRRKKIISSEEYFEMEEDLSEIPVEKGEDKRTTLSDEEKLKISQKLTSPIHKIIAWTGLNFGLRLQEYYNLRVEHLELEYNEQNEQRPRMKIDKSKCRKTRYLYLNGFQTLEWKRWLLLRSAMKLAHDYVFFRPRNPYAGGLDNESTKQIFRTIAKIAGIQLYSHRLRYTFNNFTW